MALFRPLTYMLDEALLKVRPWKTQADLEAIVGRPVMSVDPYPDSARMLDARIGWHTHIVMTSNGPAGFTDSPMPQQELTR